jgi:nucleoside-diphosphate-sugar epimerase
MKVVVTGGAGFIGHHLVRTLVEAGHTVTAMDNLRRGTFERSGLEHARCIEGDVRDYSQCLDTCRGSDAVVHLAAQANVLGSEADRDYAFETNVRGTWNVASACRDAGVGHLVFASSREVYGEPAVLPVSEMAPIAPRNTYGASKAAGELLLSSFHDGPNVSVLRLANVIGSGDAGRVVPVWLAAARENRPLTVFGGEQELDLVPVDIVCRSVERALQIGRLRGPLNIGSGVSTRILDLAAFIISLTDSSSTVCVKPARSVEVGRFRADTTLMRSTLGLTVGCPLDSVRADW